MKAFVFQPVRKGVRSKLWFARIKLDGWEKVREVCLHVTQKRVAQEKLRAMVIEGEMAGVGLSAAASIRAAANKPLAVHLAAFLAAVSARGCSKNTVGAYKRGMTTVISRTGWQKVGDVNVAGFDRWRIEHTPSPKYANDVLGFFRTFFAWMVKSKLLAVDPLADVTKSKVRNDGCKRAAFSLEQIDKLVSVVPQRYAFRAVVYQFAAYTGIRRGELNQLKWGDLELDSAEPFVTVRASISKNARTERLPLNLVAAELMRKARPDLCQPFEWVFRNRVPNMDTFHRDLKRAGIPPRDATGAKFDFHALRTTTGTMLNAAGVPPRVAMQLMRHSDMKLTMKVYTNPSGLPLAAGVAALPSFAMHNYNPPHDTPEGAVSGQNEAFPVVSSPKLAIPENSASVAVSHTKGPSDFSGDPSKVVDPSRFECSRGQSLMCDDQT